MKAAGKLEPSEEETKMGGTNESWKGYLSKSRADVGLACEGHKYGFAFVTGDKTFHKNFGAGLHREGVTTYKVPISWMESSIQISPDDFDIG
ncbi:hypothetical protein Dda_0153 [Drechslerella dactyloides]|uniref:Uncharacterized protein n=1 Tax=Drechslerella dactyloides TaxID=74499 RepID=A0AAD6J3U1_DREDA|nr:hypothetical protein Dda_0153 [Drechslerella dactyloides]